MFSATLKWTKCVDALSSKALRAVAGIKRLYFKLKLLPVDMVFKIFDNKVKTILLYGSKIWRFHKYDAIVNHSHTNPQADKKLRKHTLPLLSRSANKY